MYLSYYNLKSKPFQMSTDPEFLWLGEKHREALAVLKYAILENKDGAYEYIAWDFKTEKPSRIRGEAIILGEVLGLTSITSEGQGESIETLLELKYEVN